MNSAKINPEHVFVVNLLVEGISGRRKVISELVVLMDGKQEELSLLLNTYEIQSL